MNLIQQFLSVFGNLLKFYFIVEPWDQAIRVRLGKHLRLFGPGLHFKIPYVDVIYGQNIRCRVMSIGNQTTTTRDGQVMTISGSLSYRIADVMKLHQTLHDADATVSLQVTGAVSRYVASHDASACRPEMIVAAVQAALALDAYGLADVEFFLSGYVANIPAVRLISDSLGGYAGGQSLSTSSTSLPSAYPR